VNPKRVLETLSGLAVLKYFPAGNTSALLALARFVGNMCENEQQVEWLVAQMTGGRFSEWPGPLEMRAEFCRRYKPKDGLTVYSLLYPEVVPDALPSPERKALPPGAAASSDARAEAGLMILAKTNGHICNLGGPATPEEIASAPHWLRRIEGYE
jgi:hypothetical protein